MGLPLSVASYFGNQLTKVQTDKPPKGFMSSALVAITVDASKAEDGHRYSASRLVRERSRLRRGYPPEYKLPARLDIGVAPGARAITAPKNTVSAVSSAKDSAVPEGIGNIMTENSSLPADGTREPQ